MTTVDRAPPSLVNQTAKSNNLELEIMEPVLAKATSLLFNSGNVVASDRLKKKTNLNPQDEVSHFIQYHLPKSPQITLFLMFQLIDVLNNTLSSWVTTVDRGQIQVINTRIKVSFSIKFINSYKQENKSVICRHPEIYEKIAENEKEDISVSGNNQYEFEFRAIKLY